MPVFGRRRGSNASRSSSMASTSRYPMDQSTTSNAAVAASQAFLRSPPSNVSLSSAAAAAALRSHTTTPEPVGNLQTKRMIRRGSVSSVGSGSVIGGGRPGLERRGSSSSMTDRTFRSPSPGARNGTYNGAVSPAPDAPPVPAIPKRIPSGHQRSSSLEPATRAMSPTQNRQGGRAMSMDRRTLPPPASGRRGARLSDVNEELERSDGINFSRPRSSNPSSPVSPSSPTDKQYTHGTGAWFSEPAQNASPPQRNTKQAALDQKVARIQAAAGQPVRKTHEDTSAQGRHLSKVNHEPTAAAYETTDTIMVYDPASRTFISKPNPKPKAAPVQPQAALPQPPARVPGAYDPNTRTIVPKPESKAARPVVNTVLAPPPRNPARLSPTSSPVGQRLQKQPSIVREEPEAEEVASQTGSDYTDSGKVFTSPSGPAKSYVPLKVSKQRSSSLDIPQGSIESALRNRAGSASPSPHRSAHFSASPVMHATRHDPPPRDLSPVKSALKHSPASSIRTASPLANYVGQKSPGSEMSDTASQASQDASTTRKKKSVRVSFDEQLHEIATPTAIVRNRSPVMDDLDDEDMMMRPRPALPTFGSVRKQRVPEVAEKVTEMAPERHDASNDHVIGGILRNAHEEKSTNSSVPLETGTAEKSGNISDDSDDVNEPIAVTKPAEVSAVATAEEPKIKDFAPAPQDSDQVADLDVPAINLLPPTPGVEEEQRTLTPEEDKRSRQRASAEIKIPGSFAKSDENEAEISSAGAASATAAAIMAEQSGSVVPDSVHHSVEAPSPLLTPIGEDSDDEFSDAAEDLSELDNGGFASLDAIAVSPVAKPTPITKPTLAAAQAPESPSMPSALKNVDTAPSSETKQNGDWGQATAYWSKLSRQQREQIEREHLSSDDEAPPASIRKMKKKTISASSGPIVVAASQEPAPKSAMRKSMRAPPEPTPPAETGEVHMRKSMRSGPTSGTATTMRSGPPARPQSMGSSSALQKKSMRPASTSAAPASAVSAPSIRRQDSDDVTVSQESPYPKIQPKPNTQAQPKPKPAPAPVMTAKMQKELSHDSDSESSFRKKKRTSASVNMKRSMRGGPVEAPRNQRPSSPDPVRGKGSDSFSIRSLSPSGSLFSRKKRVEDVRQSLRGNSDAAYRTTLRNGPPAKTRSSKPAPSISSSKFKSRFGDSDDEDEDDRPKRGGFRSRFADSDDEDDDVFIPADLTPVRGIPRRKGQYDGDSTDLEDEDDDETDRRKAGRSSTKPLVPDSTEIDKAMEIARKKLGISADPTPHDSNQGESLQKGSLRNSQAPEPKVRTEDINFTPDKKKRGFMGSILRRNRGSTASVATLASTRSQAPGTPIVDRASIAPSSPLAGSPSAAIRPQSPVSPQGKLVRRSSQQPPPTRLKRGDSNYSNATAPPAMGESSLTGDWPLPPVPRIPDEYTEQENGRPMTSDGATSKVRFDEQNPVFSARTGKKKKFGLLRKAFGLND